MAPPVWVLSVDLQTKTATFQTGMADAAKSARGAFSDIKNGAASAGRETGVNMMEARHGVRMLAEEFGIRMPRALSTFVASIGPVGAAMEAAFPFLAIIALAGLLMEHLKKLKEEGEKLSESETKFITTTSTVFNNLETRLIQAGIKADELSGNHLAALKKQLDLIDRASLKDLVQELETVAKAADNVFGPLQAHWYEMGSGARGAQHALKNFKDEYESLLAQGKDTEATGLLTGTLKQAQHILDLQKTIIRTQGDATHGNPNADYNANVAARNELKKYGVGITEKEVEAQEYLVKTLQDQVTVEGKIAQLKALEGKNATASAMKEIAAETQKANEQLDKALDKIDKITQYNQRNKKLAGALMPSAEDADATGQFRELQGIAAITDRINTTKPVYTGSSAAMTLEKIKTDSVAAAEATGKIKESIESVNQKYEEQKAILDELHEQGRLNDEEYDRALKNTRKELGLVNNQWREFAQNSMKTVEAAVAFGGSWRDALKSIVVQLTEVILKMTLLKKLNEDMNDDEGGSGGGGGGGLFGGLMGGLFGGHHASGGVIPPGTWGITGEAGPEIVYGGTSGVSVYPNGQGPGSPVNVNIAIDARGADPSILTRLPSKLEAFKKEVVTAAVAAVHDRNRRTV